MMRRRIGLLVPLALYLLMAPLAAEGPPAGKLYRIGHLMLLPRELLTPFIDALETGLRDLGYVAGRNVLIEHRSAEGRAERSPRQNYLYLSAELTQPCLCEASGTSNHAPQLHDEASTGEKPTSVNS